MDDNLDSKKATETDMETQGQSTFDEEVDHQISRMMGEGGVAPPVRPRQWKTWKQDKNHLKPDDEQARLE